MDTKGWYSRGYLPHLDCPDQVQGITFRLVDSLPAAALERMVAETKEGSTERRRRIQQYLDAGHGACWLRQPTIAALVEDALLHFDGERYRLLAWVVMPNHVHVLAELGHTASLAEVVRSWKLFTARRANRLLKRGGAFWARDYFDRYVRDDIHYAAAVRYIEQNPVKAGLVARAEDWAFGSAARRQRE